MPPSNPSNQNREKIKEVSDLALVRPLMPVETESSKFLESSKRVPTLQINIEIKPGQTEVLIVREGESAE